MQKEKIALIALVIIVIAALSVFVAAVNTDIFENLFKEKLTIAEGDCADVSYIGRYASNNTIFDTSYTYVENKTGGNPLKVFVSYNKTATSPKSGYSAELIEGFMDGLIGMQEGQTKTIGPIPPEKAYGANKFRVGAVFTSQYFGFGMNQTVIVTNYTGGNLSVKWINMENLGNFTMPQLIINDLTSENESEMVIYPPPYYIWKNSTTILNITDTNITVRTTPTKATNITDVITSVQYGNIQMMVFPNGTTASWNETSITVVCTPKIGTEYILPYEYSGTWSNITVHVNSFKGDKINVTVTSEQNTEPTYYELTRNLTFNRTFVLPRYYNNIPSMYVSYFYGEDIKKAGYSIEPLAGETLLFEVTVDKIYKTSQGTI